MATVTNGLIEAVELARRRDEASRQKMDELFRLHESVAGELLGAERCGPLVSDLADDFASLEEILSGVWHVQTASEATVELVSGHGEIWSARLLNAHLLALGTSSRWLDARKALTVEPGETSVAVEWDRSRAQLDAFLEQTKSDWIVITGFVAATADGVPTTLKRDGSDYSASIFAALLEASAITIWTDVDGVLSADPRLVPEAVVLPDLSFAEATELAYFGAKVVHPSTMAPAVKAGIPIRIRNAFNPQASGTLIHAHSRSQAPVKGFAAIEAIALINVEGTGMMGVPGVAQRLFGALREIEVSVIMISQASSEHSICLAVPLAHALRAEAAIERAFLAELKQGWVTAVEVDEGCSILAAVGDNMVKRSGVSGKFLGALGRAGVNVRAIAQGASERNISVVVPRADATRALRAVHAGFFLSTHTLSIGLVGCGGVGSALLEQIAAEGARLRTELKIDLRVRALATSRRMLLADVGIELGTWEAELDAKGEPLDLERFARHVRAEHLPHAVIVDCTASESVARLYRGWLAAGLHVVTPNKKANTLEMDYYRALKAAALDGGRHFLYETTVGAGLPIINTLRELHRTGDRVLSIEGVLSGTLSYIFNELSPSRSFSEVVAEAKARGLTEPDPREDLSGLDVARKLTILAREIGLEIELSDVVIEPLLPAELEGGDVESFLRRLPGTDAAVAERLADAAAAGEVLRYVGSVSEIAGRNGRARVQLKRFPKDHPFARIQSTDNIVAFRTRRYSERPLVVQGPGAGREVTAAGAFADLLRLSSYLGAPL